MISMGAETRRPTPLPFETCLRAGLRETMADEDDTIFSPWQDFRDGWFPLADSFCRPRPLLPPPPEPKHEPPKHEPPKHEPTLRRLLPTPEAATPISEGRSAGLAPASASHSEHIVKNGYRYDYDEHKRPTRISGQLMLNDDQRRSKTAQAKAGGADRRTTDDGGHYIARRFNGPRDVFNHFAQDSKFNRGAYRVIEDRLAKAVRSGHEVFIDIIAHYPGASQRPSSIHVKYVIDGEATTQQFFNGYEGK
jgi:hypothetical protein